MIVHCMRSAGKTVATNLEGANLITGIATAMIKYSSLLGKMKTEYMVFETDERYLQYIYKLLPAKNICITNIQKIRYKEMENQIIFIKNKKCYTKRYYNICKQSRAKK